jgi:hypothetical protein
MRITSPQYLSESSFILGVGLSTTTWHGVMGWAEAVPQSVFLCAASATAADLPYFSVPSDDAGAWPEILAFIGLQAKPANMAHVFVARTGAAASVEWSERLEGGAILIFEGESSLAEIFGFRRGTDNERAGSLIDVHNPKLPIVWEKGLELPVFVLPEGARIFARERWTGAPMIAFAAWRRSFVVGGCSYRGAWLRALSLSTDALCDLGLEQPFRSSRLWAFFDSPYRSRVDLDYFAAKWRKAGIAALQVAAWHFYERDAEPDAYLKG